MSYVNPPEILKLFQMDEKFDTMDMGQDWEDILRRKIDIVATKQKK